MPRKPPSEPGVVAAPRAGDLAVMLGMTAVTVAAWGYLFLAAGDLGGGAVAMRSIGARTWMMGPVRAAWTPLDGAAVLVIWVVMMVAMMLPTAAPIVLAYARRGLRERSHGRPFAATACFAAGYLLAWGGVACAATMLQWGLGQAGWFDPVKGRGVGLFGGVACVAAGLYQLIPLKDRCLRLCQAPDRFLRRHGGYRRDPGGALRLGLLHGGACVGCGGCLMMLLFVCGVMNLFWIAAISAFVLFEKITPSYRLVSRLAALVFTTAGVILLFFALPARGMLY